METKKNLKPQVTQNGDVEDALLEEVKREAESNMRAAPRELTDEEVFFPDEDRSLGEWTPVRLSPIRSIRLIRTLSGVLMRIWDNPTLLEAYQSGDATGAQTAESVEAQGALIFDLIDEKDLVRLLSLVIDRPESWVEQNFRFSEAVLCLEEFWRREDLGKIFSAATRSAQRMAAGQAAGKRTPSASS